MYPWASPFAFIPMSLQVCHLQTWTKGSDNLFSTKAWFFSRSFFVNRFLPGRHRNLEVSARKDLDGDLISIMSMIITFF